MAKGDGLIAMTDYRYNAKIYLPTLQDILFFVGCTTCCDFNINVSKKGFSGYMNGKSLIGMIVLAGTDVLNVHYNGHDGQFEKILDKFAAKSSGEYRS